MKEPKCSLCQEPYSRHGRVPCGAFTYPPPLGATRQSPEAEQQEAGKSPAPCPACGEATIKENRADGAYYHCARCRLVFPY